MRNPAFDTAHAPLWTAQPTVARSALNDVLVVALLAMGGWLAAGDWLGALAAAVLWMIWRLLTVNGAPPVLFWAMSFEWLQVTIGMFYYGLTGRVLPTIQLSNYRPMVLIGLICVAALAVGLRLGIQSHRWAARAAERPPHAHILLTWRFLLTWFLAATALGGTLQQFAVQYPALIQPVFALTSLRLGLLFLILRRLMRPRFRTGPLVALLALETVLGFTGFFAGFKEPLMLALMALFEQFDRRRARHWIAVVLIVTVGIMAGVVWLGVRRTYRGDYAQYTSRTQRLERLVSLTAVWWNRNESAPLATVDQLVERIWAVYYPALAYAHVPAVVPHTNGALLEAAVLQAIEPRLLFPNKPDVPSDSEKVRKYSGIYVAGAESNTSIAFGYAAESYVDFGTPVMFLPVLVFGFLMGIAFSWFQTNIRYIELATALLTVVFWLSLYLFEKSWPFLIGQAGTRLLYLGAATWLVDRYLYARREDRDRASAMPGLRGPTYRFPGSAS
ncbi:MAG: hypothetical protein KGN76_06370 [Acidobacteriota bacterium]|nr:hypothetical protein [Acidobacteriota bacterium]